MDVSDYQNEQQHQHINEYEYKYDTQKNSKSRDKEEEIATDRTPEEGHQLGKEDSANA